MPIAFRSRLALPRRRRTQGDAGEVLRTRNCKTALRPRRIPACSEKNKAKQELVNLPVTHPVTHIVRVMSIGSDLKHHSAPSLRDLL